MGLGPNARNRLRTAARARRGKNKHLPKGVGDLKLPQSKSSIMCLHGRQRYHQNHRNPLIYLIPPSSLQSLLLLSFPPPLLVVLRLRLAWLFPLPSPLLLSFRAAFQSALGDSSHEDPFREKARCAMFLDRPLGTWARGRAHYMAQWCATEYPGSLWTVT